MQRIPVPLRCLPASPARTHRGTASGDSILIACVVLLAPAAALRSQDIPVEGVADCEVLTDQAVIRIPVEKGFTYEATLNGTPVPMGEPVVVGQPDYHELDVVRRDAGTGDETSRRIRFIVRSSERGSSEWGLPPWSPHPPVPSAPPEFAGATLALVAPAAWPAGRELPVVALLRDGDGRRVGANGQVRFTGRPGEGFALLRGVGSGRVATPAEPGALQFDAAVSPLAATREVMLEEPPGDPEATVAWTDVAGELPDGAAWGEDARVRVTGDLSVPAGSTLSIGAGSIVLIAPRVDLEVDGALEVRGTPGRPVVLAPLEPGAPWGGLLLRSGTASADITGAFLTGSGADPDWFDNVSGSGESHRDEQALLYISDGARAVLEDCWVIDNAGQAGHGEDAELTLRRVLVQRCITAGQYNHGSVVLEDSALVGFPAWNAPFEDDDNDALYLTGGAHRITRSLVGWALDDGIDAGSGDGGSVVVEGSWIEACYHEGLAWSEDRDADVRDTVVLECGQGIEAGWGAPDVDVRTSLSTANSVGARFGDNYDWDYEGFLRVEDSLLLHNRRDVWGRTWDDWEQRLGQMDIRGNVLSAPDPLHPDNSVWDPDADAARLEPFLATPAGPRGVGIAVPSGTDEAGLFAGGVPVRLSSFTTTPVSVDWSLAGAEGVFETGTLELHPGETVGRVRPESAGLEDRTFLHVTLEGAEGGELTGRSELVIARPIPLVPLDTSWRFLDRRAPPAPDWASLEYDDTAWGEGPAPLGFGDDAEATTVDGGPDDDRHPTTWFRHVFEVDDPARWAGLVVRLVRDDGALVRLNGEEILRSNLPPGEIDPETLAPDAESGDDEEAVHEFEVPGSTLRAGRNLLAVEVHQATADSSDLRFALALLARPRAPSGTPVFLRGDANGDRRVDVSDPITTLLVLFAGRDTSCADALDADDSGSIEIGDAVRIIDFLFRDGPAPPPPWPGPGADPTSDELDCGGS